MNVAVSVVVPTYRRDDSLRHCLERLVAQTLDRAAYEVIICDDGPSQSTRNLVESFSSVDGPAIRYLAIRDTQGPAAARNAGWRAATGGVIAFTDDDCLPERDWLAAGLAAIEQVDAVTGRTIVPLPDCPTDYERDTAGLATAEFITANCFCRRASLESVGGFDERFTAAWREDSDLHFSLLEHGQRIARAEQAVVVHLIRPAHWGVSLKQQSKGVSDPLLFSKHPDLYRQRIPPFPVMYYAATISLAFVVGAALLGMWWLAVVGGAVWLALTLEFTLRRLWGTSKAPSHIAEMLVTSALIPPLSLYWRILGLVRFRAVSHASAAACPRLDAVTR